ncbi:lipoprotein [Spiroplasma culicicola]|uniref:Lipoprotein n=1 Tax=Spiroplasma culicicola AES-1 TaxID=1276246 RepID=W6AFN9_9MOLU|nr:lipoprotein [Spiroplasma culicicola]AHI52519.1 hypothetical protein SCULI_v1c01780 [Spiroplasma culicicola AES-1]
MKKILTIIGGFSLIAIPTAFTISCFSGDMGFKSTMSDHLSEIFMEGTPETITKDEILTEIYKKYALNTDETRKGIILGEIIKVDNTTAKVDITITIESPIFYAEQFTMTIKFLDE